MQHSNTSYSIKNLKRDTYSVTLLIIAMTLLLTTGCADFVDSPNHPQTPISQTSPTPTPIPQPTPWVPNYPVPEGKPPTPGPTVEQRYWRMCEEERMWAFNTKLIDNSILQIYQSRNFSPVFNTPGERQSGIEGWYACKRALEMNGFISVSAIILKDFMNPEEMDSDE